MTRESLNLTRDEWLHTRAKDITSTEVSALFGISPYITEFELWHRKQQGTPEPFEENERMKWGVRLQDAIAAGIAADKGWDIRPKLEYMRLPSLRLGASFDYQIGETALLEIKNVDALQFRDGWSVDGDNIEAPLHIEIQVQHQLLVSGLSGAYIGALIGGNKVVLIEREADLKVFEAITKKVFNFWKSIEENRPPETNFQRDAEFIASLYNVAEPGKVIDASNNTDISALANRDRELQQSVKQMEAERDEIKARILMAIGDAEKVIGDGFTVSAGVQGPAFIEAHERAGFRRFRINWPRKKKEE